MRDKSVHEEVIDKIISFALSIGFSVLHLEYSPIKGPEGNIEYLVHLKKRQRQNRQAWKNLSMYKSGRCGTWRTGQINEKFSDYHKLL